MHHASAPSLRSGLPSSPGLQAVLLAVLLIGAPLPALSQVVFTEITADLGLAHEYSSTGSFGPGVAVSDFDQDGDLDLYVSNDLTGNMLYQNNGDGTLTEVAWEVGLGYLAALPREEDRTYPTEFDVGSMMPCFLDLDRDGDKDLFLTCYNTYNRLYENLGDGFFVDRTFDSGLATVGHAATAAFGDYDLDGLLDVYIADWGGPDRLFRNRGGLYFADVSNYTGIWDIAIPEQPSWAAAWFYQDDDRWPDLYVGIDYGYSNLLFMNQGGMGFSEDAVGHFPEMSEPGYDLLSGNATMGLALADYDHDGDFDLFVANSNKNNLYRRDGDLYFDLMKSSEYADQIRPLKDLNIGWFCAWPDVDCDGWVDILLVNGYMRLCPPDVPECMLGKPYQANRLWMNDQNGSWYEVTEQADLWDESWGRSAAVTDFDMDGDLDFYIVNNNGEHKYHRNDTVGAGNWLTVGLRGVQSNHEGQGARVTARTGSMEHLRLMSSCQGYLAQSFEELHFGLGEATVVDELEIIWPSGRVDRWLQVPVNQRLVLQEGASAPERASAQLMRIETLGIAHAHPGVELSWQVDPDIPWQSFRVMRCEDSSWAGTLATVEATPGQSDYGFVDAAADPQTEYRYLICGSYDGIEVGSVARSTAELELSVGDTGDQEPSPEAETVFGLRPPSPNPFRDHTVFRFRIPERGEARVRVVDAMGRVVRELEVRQEAGGCLATWDGSDARGRKVASGSYRAVLDVSGRRSSVAVLLRR